MMVFWMKEIALPNFNRSRVRFRIIFSGRVTELTLFIKRDPGNSSVYVIHHPSQLSYVESKWFYV